jgi:hypothetical protein
MAEILRLLQLWLWAEIALLGSALVRAADRRIAVNSRYSYPGTLWWLPRRAFGNRDRKDSKFPRSIR